MTRIDSLKNILLLRQLCCARVCIYIYVELIFYDTDTYVYTNSHFVCILSKFQVAQFEWLNLNGQTDTVLNGD